MQVLLLKKNKNGVPGHGQFKIRVFLEWTLSWNVAVG